ncbi:MAG: hypothetical protein JNM46_02740 [Anaerolineales bacterium]|nr:hypothetical protein [Anaerolineales bacterium]
MKKTSLILWVFLRLPILLAGLYLFRAELAVWIERHFNLALVIESLIYLISTAWIRLLLIGFTAIVLIVIYLMIKKWLGNIGNPYPIFVLSSFVLFAVFLTFLLKVDLSNLGLGLVTLILAINTLPENWLDRYITKNKLASVFFTIGAGISEAVFLQTYFHWLVDSLGLNKSIKKWSWLTGILLACFYFFFSLTPYNNQRVLTLGEKIHANSAVEKFSSGGYNWIDLNLENNLLYASGHNVNYIMAYDLENLDLPPRRSNVQVGKPQSFAYNPDLQEIYVYRADAEELLYLNAVTLELLRSVPVPNLAPGDVWVNWQSGTDTITLASEADRDVGFHFVMINRVSGEIIISTDLSIAPTSVAFDVENHVFYFNSFLETQLFSWDMVSHQVLQQSPISPNTDRLIYDPITSEVLVASPQDGAILRYDGNTLKFKGEINTSLGDRTLALDSKRNLLLVGNFINNYMQVIDLNTYQPIARYYIGPWIRTIALDTEKGIAYVSTIHNLFKVTYIK